MCNIRQKYGIAIIFIWKLSVVKRGLLVPSWQGMGYGGFWMCWCLNWTTFPRVFFFNVLLRFGYKSYLCETWKLKKKTMTLFILLQFPSHVWLFASPWAAACQASLSSTISRSLLKFIWTELMMLSNHLTPCHPLCTLIRSGFYAAHQSFCRSAHKLFWHGQQPNSDLQLLLEFCC